MFKKLLFTLSVLITLTFRVNSQSVYLPDPNWRDFLASQIGTFCVVGDSLILNCGLINSVTTLDCSGLGISQVTGLEYMLSLTTFNCNVNSIYQLNNLPPSLTYLSCNSNSLDSIPFLPNLTYLSCSQNHFTSLTNLPSTLTFLDCHANSISNLDYSGLTAIQSIQCSDNNLSSLGALPASLQVLDVSKNNLTSLPSFPAGFLSISCNENAITQLPALPQGLTQLNAKWNNISSIPTFPSTLRDIALSGNPMPTIPALPSFLNWLDIGLPNMTSLPPLPDSTYHLLIEGSQINLIDSFPRYCIDLSIGHTPLTSIPALPPELAIFHAVGSFLTSLPVMPQTTNAIYIDSSQIAGINGVSQNMSTIYARSSALSCLPPFNSINYIDLRNTNVHCLPNYFTYLYSYTNLDSLPFCQPSDGCPINWNISGVVYKDGNTDCVNDAGEARLENIPVKLDSAGVLIQTSLTNKLGQYSFRAPLGTYGINVDSSSFQGVFSCPTGGIQSVTLLPTDSLVDSLSFGTLCGTGQDFVAGYITDFTNFVVGRFNLLDIHAGEFSDLIGMDCYIGSGVITVTVNGPVDQIVAAPYAIPPTSIVGNVVTWNISDLSQLNQIRDLVLSMHTSMSANVGDTICVTTEITPANDNNPLNNIRTECFAVTASHDPNDKTVSPQYPDTSDYTFVYTIRFQNTGTASAENIYILDTLDANLAPATFELISSSHEVVTQILPGNILRFNYANINLADSTSNELLSHGFVKYQIQRRAGTTVGTVINNTANIFFDYNEPVVTNTATVTISINNVIHELAGNNSLIVFPNPTNNEVSVSANAGIEQLWLYDSIGKLMLTRSGIGTEKMNVPVSNLAPGIYFVKVQTRFGISQERIVKQ